MKEILQVQGLTKTFRLSARQQRLERTGEKVRRAVDNLPVRACEVAIVGQLGPNGAGKTTTLRMLSTLIRPDSGDALVDGASVVRQPEQVRSRIGFLTSELKLEECFTPDYLFDFFSDLHGVDRERREKRKEELFARFGSDRYAQVKAASLSTGMKQKVSLVVSIVHDPDIIIFAAPTNGLDVLTAKVVTDFLQQLRDQGKTIIVSTHIFSLIEKLCDRVGVIINGRMVLCDALDRVTAGESLEDRFFEIYRETVGDGV